MADSIIAKKSYDFALLIIRTAQQLRHQHKEYVLTKQLLRSGTSIGANAEEATSAESRADFIHKMSIALKEARETSYWLRLLHDSNYLSDADFYQVHEQCREIIKILSSIILTTKKSANNS
ncbi:four helix bundle protein [Catalinimonas alkaloidigena]|uniref:four helix bundle protein n=1 Tax=Catalinimonas alkaloidigena TaxID=1075417 RepID=UPI000B7EAC23|nr:four helix bundle protein [Catalinimonas alkaloidigena]